MKKWQWRGWGGSWCTWVGRDAWGVGSVDRWEKAAGARHGLTLLSFGCPAGAQAAAGTQASGAGAAGRELIPALDSCQGLRHLAGGVVSLAGAVRGRATSRTSGTEPGRRLRRRALHGLAGLPRVLGGSDGGDFVCHAGDPRGRAVSGHLLAAVAALAALVVSQVEGLRGRGGGGDGAFRRRPG